MDGKAFPPYIEVRNTCAANSVEAFICEVARCEAPIKIDVLTSYVRERFPEHCQNRNDKYIHTEIYQAVNKSDDLERRGARGDFIYRKGAEIRSRQIGPRAITQIAPEELEADLFQLLLDDASGLRRRDLKERVCGALGCQLDNLASNQLDTAIDRLKSEAEVHDVDGRTYQVVEADGIILARELVRKSCIPVEEPEDDSPRHRLESHEFDGYHSADPMKNYRLYGSVEDQNIQFVRDILRVEAPVHRNVVVKRMGQRMGRRSPYDSRVRNETNAAINKLLDNGAYREEIHRRDDHQEDKFISFALARYNADLPRQAGDRTWNEIPPEELEAGLLQVLEWWQQEDTGTGLPWDDLIDVTFNKFKFSDGDERAFEKAIPALLDALDRLIASGDAAYGGSDEEMTVVLKRRGGRRGRKSS